MHQIDPLRGDDALKPKHAERHCERVLGRRRKADKEAADRLQFARQRAGVGRHQRPRAGLGQRRRDGERRAFVAARVGRRNDLENGPAGERRVRRAPEGRERVDAQGGRAQGALKKPVRRRVSQERRGRERLTWREGSAKSAQPCASARGSSRRGARVKSS